MEKSTEHNGLTHIILVDSSIVIYWTSPFVILGASGLFCHLYSMVMEILSANSVYPNQTPRSVASDQGLHCLPMTLLYGFLGKNGLHARLVSLAPASE